MTPSGNRRWPSDEIMTLRGGAGGVEPARRRRLVSRNGPRWFVPNVVSKPAAVGKQRE